MAVFKCKMCGGTLEINNGDSVAVCEYCGTKQTLPKFDNEKFIHLHDRANHFRRENEFDKAMGIYEMILSEDKEDSESYWGIVLCRYGIEYVEDPRTHRRIPTVNRTQYTSIFDDEDYKKATLYADGFQRDIYIAEAEVINKIQKHILEISNKEEPFDIFICYKETDESGNRTQDSVYAQDIYTALTKEGYKVFFSRITLEEKLGSAYEPYIFAALNSSKVMLVVGTEKDNFNSVWVKNEWSRYLNLIKAGKEKTLIPVYKNISPYGLPEEFRYLQAQDLGKVGAVQDLLRGIEKIIGKKSQHRPQAIHKETPTVSNNTAALLKRGYISLEDGEWQKADGFFEDVLNQNAECAEAYAGKLCAELELKALPEITASVKKTDDIKRIQESKNYEKAVRFAKGDFITELGSYVAELNRLYESFSAAEADEQRKRKEQELKILEKAEEQDRKAEEQRKEHEPEIKEIQRHYANPFNRQTVVNCYDCQIVLKSDGSVATYGNNNIQHEVNWNNIVGIAAGKAHTVGLKTDGTVVAKGNTEQGQCDVDGWTDIVAVSASDEHTVGLKYDGTVVATKYKSTPLSYNGQCDVGNWNGIVAIYAVDENTIGLKFDGTVVTVGSNEYGQCDVDGWTDIVDIRTGEEHTVGLKSDGTVVACGNNQDGRCNVKYWTDIVAISAGNKHTVGLKSDGTVVAVGANDDGQCNVEGWTDIAMIDAYAYHTIGLKADGKAVCSDGLHGGNKKWKNTVAVIAGSYDTGITLDGDIKSDLIDSELNEKMFESFEDFYETVIKRQKDYEKFIANVKRIHKEKVAQKRAKAELNKQERFEAERRLMLKQKSQLQARLNQTKGLFSNTKRKRLEEQIAEIDGILNNLK